MFLLSWTWIGYVVLTTLLPTACIYFIASMYCKRKGLPKPSESKLALLFLALYIGLVFEVTGSGTIYDFLRTGFEYHPEQINLIPFSTNTLKVQIILNAVMFMPLGVLLPIIWPQVSKFRYVFAYGFGLSLFIELSQLLNSRATDVDDLIMNTLGALIGFALVWIVRAIRGRRPRSADKVSGGSKWMPALYLGGMALGYFLLYNAMGLAMTLPR